MLFEAVTKRADTEGVKCYLESSKNVPNVKIYERMGFEMSMEMECRDGEDACMVCSWCFPCHVFSPLSPLFDNPFAGLAYIWIDKRLTCSLDQLYCMVREPKIE